MPKRLAAAVLRSRRSYCWKSAFFCLASRQMSPAGRIESSVPEACTFGKFIAQPRTDWLPVGKLERQWVPMLASNLELIVQVRTGRESRLSNITDHVALFDIVTRTKISSVLRQVSVQRAVCLIVTDNHRVPIS